MDTKTRTILALCATLLLACGGSDDSDPFLSPDASVPIADAAVTPEPATCPADYPVYCAASGRFGDECWSEDTDCATRKVCPDGKEYACTAGYTVDCTKISCEPVGGGGTPTPTIPAWLVGTYYRTGRQENNIYFTTDDRSLSFSANGTYRQQVGNAAETTGRFSFAGNVVTFIDGALGGTALNLGTYLDTTCRVLNGYGTPLWRHSEVNGCPTATRVAPADCANVGTFKKVTHSGDIGGSGSGSESDYTETVTLYRDKFYTINQDRYSTTCFQFNCKSLSNRIQTLVGQWSPAAGAFTYTLAQLHGPGWTFTPSTTSCP